MALPAARRYTVDEYLESELHAVDRHEFHDGEILAISGGTYAHSRINANVIRALGDRLNGSSCTVVDSNVRTWIEQFRRYLYPDTTVVCGPPQFDPKDRRQMTILNPTLIVEVLSDSNEAYDRGAKFRACKAVDSLKEYVLVSQDALVVETLLRQGDGTWSHATAEGIEATATLRSLGIDLPLAEVYANVPPPLPAPETADTAR